MSGPQRSADYRPPRPPRPDLNFAGHNAVHSSVVVKFKKPSNDDESPESITLSESVASGSASTPCDEVATDAVDKWIGSRHTAAEAASRPSLGKDQPRFSNPRKRSPFKSSDDSSLFSGIKGKLQNNLTAVIGKIDEIYPNAHIGEKIEKRLQKFGSLDEDGKSAASGAGRTEREGRYGVPKSQSSIIHNRSNLPIEPKREQLLYASKPEDIFRSDLSASTSISPVKPGRTESLRAEVKSPLGSDKPSAFHGSNSASVLSQFASKSHPVSNFPLSHSDTELIQNQVKVAGEEEAFYDSSESLIAEDKENNQSKLGAPTENQDPTLATMPSRNRRRLADQSQYRKLNLFFQGAIMIGFIAVFLVYFPIPFAAYTFLGGVAVMWGITKVTYWFEVVHREPVVEDKQDGDVAVGLTFMDNRVTEADDGVLKGWINFSKSYDHLTFRPGIMNAVFVELEGSVLRMCYPTEPIPRRTMWSDPPLTNITFSRKRTYDLSEAQVDLLPENLCKTRRWSKKYPIRVITATLQDSNKLSATNLRTSPSDKGSSKDAAESSDSHHTDQSTDDEQPPGTSQHKPSRKQSRRQNTSVHRNEAVSSTNLDASGSKLPDPDPTHTALERPLSASHQYASAPTGLSNLGTNLTPEKDKSPSARQKSVALYFFGRTGRDKELWFRRLYYAAHGMTYPSDFSSLLRRRSLSTISTKSQTSVYSRAKDEVILDSTLINDVSEKDSDHLLIKPDILIKTYLQHMGRCLPYLNDVINHQSIMDSLKPVTGINGIPCEIQTVWINALMGRLLLDVLTKEHFRLKAMQKIQKKLNKLHLPYFIDQPTLSDLHLGHSLPLFQHLGLPVLNEQGLWIELDLNYSGQISFTMETKLNLNKIKDRATSATGQPGTSAETGSVDSQSQSVNRAVYDSDEEDSNDSSSEEEASEHGSLGGKEPAKKRIMRMVDKVSDSPLFQWVTDHKVVQKAMSNVSSTRLALSAELNTLAGRMTVNIPPPPTDRIWFAFKTNPRLNLTVKPQLGAHDVGKTRIAEFIQKKLIIEFQKVLVFPNMEDVAFPALFDSHIAPSKESTKHDQSKTKRD